MRRSLVCICAGLGLFPRIFGEVLVEPAEIDWGVQRQNQELRWEVRLNNTGSEPVAIIGVESDCSCSTGKPAASVIEAGVSTTLEVRFATRQYQGDVRRHVVVHTSAGDVRLALHAEVAPYERWTVTPVPVVMRPSLKSETSTTSFTVEHVATMPAHVLEVAANQPWLAAQLEEVGSATIVHLSKNPEAPVGTTSAAVTLRTDDAVEPELVVPVVVPVATAARIVPNPVRLPTVRAGETARAAFRILGWQGAQPPTVTVPVGVVTSLGELNGEYTFEIAFTPAVVGSVVQTIKVTDGEVLQFEAHVTARAE